MRALITGGGGQLASDLAALLGDSAVALSHAELDIADDAALAAALEDVRPDVVYNCAAFHNLGECERSPDRAWEVNVRAVRELARHSPRLVHISTNYVFDGRRPEPYGEADLPAPRSVYALTKLAGEHAALAYNDRALVVRAAGLYGLHGSASKGGNFVQRMVARAREQGSLTVVADQRVQPTYTEPLAGALVEAVERDVTGLLHLTSAGECTWHEFTEEIVRRAGVDVPVEPGVTDPDDPIDRPLNGVLADDRARELGLEPLADWRDGLADYMARAGLAVQPAGGGE